MTLEEFKSAIKNFDVKEGTHYKDFFVVITRNDDIRVIANYDMLFSDDFVWCLEEFENVSLKKSYMFLNNESGKFEVHLEFVDNELNSCVNDDAELDIEDCLYLRQLVYDEYNKTIGIPEKIDFHNELFCLIYKLNHLIDKFGII